MSKLFEENITQESFTKKLKKVYALYTLGFVSFCVVLAVLEQVGVSQEFIGYSFLFATIFLYAGIGFLSKTNEPDNYYVAGRRVPALFNGMATGADWMSAASFIGMAGGLYVGGYKGLAMLMGGTGGDVFVALLLVIVFLSLSINSKILSKKQSSKNEVTNATSLFKIIYEHVS